MRSRHGGDIYSRRVELDFSANINPLGMPKGVKAALRSRMDDFARYPDTDCRELKKAIAVHEQAEEETIVCGNGAADLIYRVVQAVKPKTALLPAPVFTEYERALKSAGCRVEHYLTEEKEVFTITEDILPRIPGKDILFLCSPNNPVGNLTDPGLMKRIVEVCGRERALLVVDQCFLDFAEDAARYRMQPAWDHVIVLKAFTKLYAMAGLRLGYLMCKDRRLTTAVEDCGQCWSVSVPAQIAGTAALKETDYVKKTVEMITEERGFLADRLVRLGCRVYPSKVNFLLFRTGDFVSGRKMGEQSGNGLPLDRLLADRGIAIRGCGDFRGLSQEYYRIAVRTHPENVRLVGELERILKNG